MKTKFGILTIFLITMLMGFSYAGWRQEIPTDVRIKTGEHDARVELGSQNKSDVRGNRVKDKEFSESFEISVRRSSNNGIVNDEIFIINNGNIPMEIDKLEIDFGEMKKKYSIEFTDGEGEEAVVLTESIEEELPANNLVFVLESKNRARDLSPQMFIDELKEELSGSWKPGEKRSIKFEEKVNDNTQGASYTWSYTLTLDTVVYK